MSQNIDHPENQSEIVHSTATLETIWNLPKGKLSNTYYRKKMLAVAQPSFDLSGKYLWKSSDLEALKAAITPKRIKKDKAPLVKAATPVKKIAKAKLPTKAAIKVKKPQAMKLLLDKAELETLLRVVVWANSISEQAKSTPVITLTYDSLNSWKRPIRGFWQRLTAVFFGD